MKQAGLGAAVKIFKANAAEYFGHRKNGILRIEVGIFCEAHPKKFHVEQRTQKAALRRLFVFFQGNVSLAKRFASFYITVGADAKRAGAVQKY
ncbi:MAG: hypothetical protein IKK14_07200 [Oscillospiraceae bacterium]|nr:hypothetical protein [Oscillospiraceae bacterium]